MTKGKALFGVIFSLFILEVIAQLATGSLNPIEVFRGDKLLLKILVGFLGLWSVGQVLMFVLVATIGGDARCPSARCGGRPLIKFAPALGGVVGCIFCGRQFHGDCFRAGGGRLAEGCKQPPCRSARSFDI